MVSIRKRKLLGLYSGTNSFTAPLFPDSSNATRNPVQDSKPGNVHPMPLVDVNQPVTILKVDPGAANESGSGSSKEHHQWLLESNGSMKSANDQIRGLIIGHLEEDKQKPRKQSNTGSSVILNRETKDGSHAVDLLGIETMMIATADISQPSSSSMIPAGGLVDGPYSQVITSENYGHSVMKVESKAEQSISWKKEQTVLMTEMNIMMGKEDETRMEEEYKSMVDEGDVTYGNEEITEAMKGEYNEIYYQTSANKPSSLETSTSTLAGLERQCLQYDVTFGDWMGSKVSDKKFINFLKLGPLDDVKRSSDDEIFISRHPPIAPCLKYGPCYDCSPALMSSVPQDTSIQSSTSSTPEKTDSLMPRSCLNFARLLFTKDIRDMLKEWNAAWKRLKDSGCKCDRFYDLLELFIQYWKEKAEIVKLENIVALDQEEIRTLENKCSEVREFEENLSRQKEAIKTLTVILNSMWNKKSELGNGYVKVMSRLMDIERRIEFLRKQSSVIQRPWDIDCSAVEAEVGIRRAWLCHKFTELEFRKEKLELYVNQLQEAGLEIKPYD